jgi:probable phosphoglycerate mutase
LNPIIGSSLDYDDLFPYYGGEYREEVVKRMSKCLIEIMENNEHHNVLVVSHGGACYSFLSTVIDPDIIRNNGGFTNCCILHFEYEDENFKYINIIRPDLKVLE